jgi:amino acid adenylation domain-containing protein
MNKSKMKEEGNFTGLEIAVIGMAGRFPGANNVDDFWDNLKNGIDSGNFYSDVELLAAGVDKDLIDHPDYVKAGRYIEGKECFDSNFFGYLPAEASIMDPQIRIFHECVWTALEDSGYDPETYNGLIGLYAGAGVALFWQAYSTFITSHSDISIDPFAADQLRNRDFIATLVSYRLNLKGPAVFMHTACSTSLVAIHNACRGLLTGESHIALAGGVSLNHNSNEGYLYREGTILAPDGCCRAFDAEAKGTVGGEGAAVVVLKRLKKAIADRDNILAIVKGSAINNDGLRKIGYSAPSEDGQADVIQMAHKLARVESQSISYIETHGTGTILGDPIEMEALIQVFGKSKEKYCAVGSVKTNVGHIDTAAGVAGFIKTVLAIKHQQIPPSLHFKTPNPRIDFENSPFYVNTELKEWKNQKYPLRAGVSSFGIGGTNAHVVLEEAPPLEHSSPGREYQLLLLSAKTAPALYRMRENLKKYLKKNLTNPGNPANPINPGLNMADVAYTLQAGRQHFRHRITIVCKDTHEAIDILSAEETDRIKRFTMGKECPSIVFMFSGQGSQYVNMGLGLYKTEPVFRSEMDRCFELLKGISGRDMKWVLYPGEVGERDSNAAEEKLNRFDYTSPIKFVFDYSLAVFLMKWGIKPDAMIGHSFGEYTAACLAGVFSLEDALHLSVARGKLFNQMTEGFMLSVPLSEEELKPLLEATKDLSLAAVNAESLCLASGPVEAVNRLEAQLNEQGYECLRLNVPRAAHSWMMEEITEEFLQKLGQVKFNKPQIPYISGLTGTWIIGEDAVDPGYWKRHLLQTIRFADGLTTLMKMKEANPIFLQMGPDRGLPLFVNRHPDKKPGTLVLNLVRHRKEKVSDIYHLLEQIGLMWLHGVTIDWKLFYAREKRRRISLPTYPFEKIKYPVKADISKLVANIGTGRLPTDDLQPYPQPQIQMEDWEWQDRQEARVERPSLSTPYREPSTQTECALVEIWRNFFNIGKIGIDDDFYELGGDSLKGTSLCNMIHKGLNIRVPLAEFFAVSTIRELATYIDASQIETFAAVEKAEEKEYYVLSSAQKRLYFVQQMFPASTAYNIPLMVPLRKNLDKEQLDRIFERIIQRHESFRTSFRMIEEETVQQIHKDVKFEIEYFNVERRAECIECFVRPFNLSKAPLLRAGLLEGNPGDTPILMVDMHHIISDVFSLKIVEKEFTTLASGEELPRLPLQYKDYTERQNSEKQKRAIKKQGKYWLKTFEGELPILHLPTDYPRPAVQSFEGSRCQFTVGSEDTKRLQELGASHGATLYIVLLGIFNVLMAKLSGQEDIVVGVPTAGRRHAELEHIIGMFVNTLALRNSPCPGKAFDTFLMEVKKQTLEAFDNQEYQFEDLVELVPVSRDAARNPLFDMMFVLQNIDNPGPGIPGSTVRPYGFETDISKFDLTLVGFEAEEGLVFMFEYCTKLFKKETIERIIGYFTKSLAEIIKDPRKKLAEIEIISEVEKNRVLYDFNNIEAEYPGGKTIHELFEEQAEKKTDGVAVIGHGCMDAWMHGGIHITYRELNQKANRVAYLLREKGVLADNIIGIKMERSVEMIIGILGILKSGGAYLPIDPGSPQERIDYMLNDSKASLLFTSEELSDVGRGTKSCAPTTRNPHLSLAYIIYTSGSTGRPKGVMVEHSSLVNILSALQAAYPLSESDTYLFKTSYIFDVSAAELFGWFWNGGRLAVLEVGGEKDPGKIIETIQWQYITHINFVPSMFSVFAEYVEQQGCENFARLSSLKYIFLAGEALFPDLVERFASLDTGITLENIYGPTEAAIYSSWYSLAHWDGKDGIPIGKPMPNIRIYILDNTGSLQPVGIPGELCIAGTGVARGYLNNPELTAERFVTHHSSLIIHRFYRTGDLARWLPDGNIEFLGRMDQQVKIRGFRIESGEIESRLLRHPGVKEAVVVTREVEKSDKYLCAYIVPGSARIFGNHSSMETELRDHLSASLPDYMIPTHFVQVEKIPLNPSGKVDRKALPEPGIKPGETYAAPRDEVEERLAAIWSEILGLDKKVISIDANFFLLGGHSLKATILIARIHKAFNVKATLGDMFRKPTIRGLSELIKAAGSNIFTAVEPLEKKEYYPLSSAQKRIYILQRMVKDNIFYNNPAAVALEGEIDKEKFEVTLQQLITRHETLRTSIEMIHAQSVQRVHEDVVFALEYEEYDEMAEEDVEKRIVRFIRPFDLSWAPLMRGGLIKTGEKQHIVMYDMHHIITDGTSMQVFIREFLVLYAGNQLPPLKIHYKDFSRWQNRLFESDEIRKQQKYWRNQFEGEIPVLNIPTDYPRPEIQRFEGNTVRFEIGSDVTRALNQLANKQGATLYMVLLGIYSILLSKLSGQEDIIIGNSIAGRQHADLHFIIGMFVNTLVMRNYPAGTKNVKEFLDEVKKRTLAAFENQDYPFEELVDQIAVNRNTSRNPLFDVMFVLQNIAVQSGTIPDIQIPDLKTSPYQSGTQLDPGAAKFDLTLVAVETGEKLSLIFEYSSSLFKKETIERFTTYFKWIAEDIFPHAEKKIADIEMISPEEKNRLLREFNQTRFDYPVDKTIHELFIEQAKTTPDHIAIVGAQGTVPFNDIYLTYRELNEKSDQLAHHLRSRGVGPETIAAIMVERSIELIIGILGILKAGGAYLPIDPGSPRERIDYMLNDSKASLLLTSEELSDVDRGTKFCAPTTRNPHLSLAYIIYTSGTTGRPKGVLIHHRGVVNMVWFHRHVFKENPRSRISQVASAVFDAMAFEIWPCLLGGAALYIIDNETRMHPQRLKEWIIGQQITISFQPTRMAQELLEEQWPERVAALEVLRTAGERLTCYPTRHYPFRFYNLYGPTEDTVWSTWIELSTVNTAERLNPPPIGKPAANKQVFILSSDLKLQPVGVVGELCISGDGLAHGYLNNPELTVEKFVLAHDSWLIADRREKKVSSSGELPMSYELTAMSYLYKTGDLARWLSDGNIEFFGRIDEQVKIRGFRIEPGEIQNRLLAYDLVKSSVVLAIEEGGETYLCAYIVTKETFDLFGLKDFLSKSLPEYMIPSYFVEIDKIPLTPNGKVDRKALPQPEVKSGEAYMAPGDDMEKQLVDIWSEVLGLGKGEIGINDDFFRIGGHSLKAAAVISGIQKEFAVDVPLVEIFRIPTIKQLARYIRENEAEGFLIRDENLTLLKKQDTEAKHLFLVHDGSGEVEGYIEFCRSLKNGFNCWGIRADRDETYSPKNLAVEKLAGKYIEKIKNLQPGGPYFIAGWSLGGTIAFEMVNQLEQRGEDIAFFAIIDSPPPRQVHVQRDMQRFSLETEKHFVARYLSQRGSEQIPEPVTSMDDFWAHIVDYLEVEQFNVLSIRQVVMQYEAHIVPNYHDLDIGQLVKYLNTGRTFQNARAMYTPSRKIHTSVHYFAASQSEGIIANDYWNEYCRGPIKTYRISGDHYSIFRKPEVLHFTESFSKRLERCYYSV